MLNFNIRTVTFYCNWRAMKGRNQLLTLVSGHGLLASFAELLWFLLSSVFSSDSKFIQALWCGLLYPELQNLASVCPVGSQQRVCHQPHLLNTCRQHLSFHQWNLRSCCLLCIWFFLKHHHNRRINNFFIVLNQLECILATADDLLGLKRVWNKYQYCD
jgi:hypothetical protein